MPDSNVNLINPKTVSAYLYKFTEGYEEPDLLWEYLSLAIEKPLRKDDRFMQRVDHLPQNAPDWLVEKWGECAFHRFVPNETLYQKITHIKDWIVACLRRGEPWLEAVDSKKRPLKLLKLGSLEQAIREAEKDRAFQHQKNQNEVDMSAAFADEIDNRDIVVVKAFDDGYRMVQILSSSAAMRESSAMQNCLGDGAYDDCFRGGVGRSNRVIYSLRDANNNPHVTMEVYTGTGFVSQCVGKQNKPPAEEYISKLCIFIAEFELDSSSLAERMGGVFKDGEVYPLTRLPDNYEYQGDLRIERYDDFQCPENLTVKGSLYIKDNQKELLKPCLKVSGFIDEQVTIDAEHYCVIRHKGALGKIYSESWYEFASGLHKEGAPAIIDYDVRTGRIISEKWYWFGVLHRERLPAVTRWKPATGQLLSESYYRYGQYVPSPDADKVA